MSLLSLESLAVSMLLPEWILSGPPLSKILCSQNRNHARRCCLLDGGWSGAKNPQDLLLLFLFLFLQFVSVTLFLFSPTGFCFFVSLPSLFCLLGAAGVLLGAILKNLPPFRGHLQNRTDFAMTKE